MKLSRISLAILPLLSLCSVQAAVYNVVEIGEVSEVKSTYAAAINDAGNIVANGALSTNTSGNGNGLGSFNFPLDLDIIDFESAAVTAVLTDEQIADAINGNVDANVMGILLSTNPSNQQIGYSLAYTTGIDGILENLPLRDVTQKRSNSEYLYDINNSGVAVGTASSPFALESFTAEPTDTTPDPEEQDIWVPELPYRSGMVVRDGEIITTPPAYEERRWLYRCQIYQ